MPTKLMEVDAKVGGRQNSRNHLVMPLQLSQVSAHLPFNKDDVVIQPAAQRLNCSLIESATRQDATRLVSSSWHFDRTNE